MYLGGLLESKPEDDEATCVVTPGLCVFVLVALKFDVGEAAPCAYGGEKEAWAFAPKEVAFEDAWCGCCR